MAGKWLKVDEDGTPVSIVSSQPERGVQLQAPGAPEDEVVRAHVKAAEDAIKEAKDAKGSAKDTASK